MLSRRAILVGCAAMWSTRASAEQEVDESGTPVFRPSQDLADWFYKLKIPFPDEKNISPYGVSGCCDYGDAYPIKILEEPVPRTRELTGFAVVTDPSRRKIITPDDNRTIYRYQITGKLDFKFSGMDVTLERDGNPTKTAWVFCRVDDGQITKIYCVVPLPPGF